MKKSTSLFFGLVCSFAISTSIYSQSQVFPGIEDYGSLSPDRFPSSGWSAVHWDDPGGWTTVDVTTAGISPGGSNSAPTLVQLADQATVPTIFYFPPGDYTFTSAVDINDSNIIIRGAGSDQTRFFLDGSGTHEIRFIGWDDDPIDILSSVAENAQSFSVASTGGLAVGDLVEVSQELPEWDAEWGIRSWGQLVFITAISGNQVTVDLPLSLGLDGTRRPQVQKINAVRNVGVEDLYIERKQYGESNNIEMRSVYNGFIRNVESANAVKFHAFVYRSRQVEISGNYFHDAQNYGTGGHGYGVNLENLSTNILVTNNIFKNLRHHILVQTGTNHSVISYNYNVDIVELVDLSMHGHYSNHNLYEGNIVWWAGFADFWGKVGPENTLYRNQIGGRAEDDEGVVIYDDSDRQNVLGNDFLRNSRIAKDADVDDTYEEGNVISGQVEWNSLSNGSTLPASLYLTEAPDFWGNQAWPPFGPDASGSATNRIPAQDRHDAIIGGGGGPGDTNERPSVEITAPAGGTNFEEGDVILVEATASDIDGIVTGVDFYIDGVLHASDIASPYSYEWTGALEGSYVLTANAIDDDNETTVSEEVFISVSKQEDHEIFISGVSASDSREDAAPENTLDGSLYTRWAAHGDGQWIQYDLSGVATLASIGIAWGKGHNRVAYFDVVVSQDEQNWVDALKDGESSGTRKTMEYYAIDPVDAKYVRIIGHGTSRNAWNMISEVSLSVESFSANMTGDPSGNGQVSAHDAALVLEHSIGQDMLIGNAVGAGDVTGNGEVSPLDASLILKRITGLIDCFPIEADCQSAGKMSSNESGFVLPRIIGNP